MVFFQPRAKYPDCYPIGIDRLIEMSREWVKTPPIEPAESE